MFKKKQKKSDDTQKKVAPMFRVDTESDVLPHKESKTRAEFQQRFQYQSNNQPIKSARLKLNCKQLQKLFLTTKNLLQEQLDNILIGQPILKTYNLMLQSQLFRVKTKTKDQVTEDLSKIIQALQLLYSKLHNNQKVKDILYVKDQSELLLFFKHLFGKPYTLCNLANFRKVLNTIWQHQIFKSFQAKKMVDHLRQWCIGIQYPLNPAAIPLHRLVFNNPSMIKKYALLLCNNVTYCHIDSGDCMGLTPLLVAIHSNKSAAYQQIVKTGANLFRCPLIWIKNTKLCTNTKKSNKQLIQIQFPIKQRKQYNCLQILLHHKQYQQIVNLLSLNQVYKLKRLKKTNTQIHKKLLQIPDCCLQIHWKTFKGFLSFKQLPKDIITVFKKGGFLRIDYHVDDIQQINNQPKHYSILIKTCDQQGNPTKFQYYYINHPAKKINNFMKQIHKQKLKLRYQQITQLGNIQQQYISYLKSNIKNTQQIQNMQVSVQYQYQNISKAMIYDFKDLNNYQRALFQSDTIDYGLLEDSQTKCTTKQVIGQVPKVKSKVVKSQSSFKIQWIKQKINLSHIVYILNLIDKKSPLFLKINSLFDVFMKEQIYADKYCNKLPSKMIVDLGSDFSLQLQIKNLTYMTLDNAIFGVQFRKQKMSYQQQNVGLQSLQQTMIMQQNYSINMSRFLGKTQKLLDLQQQQANKKFQELLSREIAGQELSDQEDSSYNQNKEDLFPKIMSQRSVKQ